MTELVPYIVEYNDPWDCFDRTTIKATDGNHLWHLIKEKLKPGSRVLRVYSVIYEGEYMVE